MVEPAVVEPAEPEPVGVEVVEFEPVEVGPVEAVGVVESVGVVLALATGGAAVWSGTVDGVGEGDVAVRPADVSAADLAAGGGGASAAEWEETAVLGPGYEIGFAGGPDAGGLFDVSVPLPGGAEPGDVVFVWFDTADGGRFEPGVYDAATGLVTASVPAAALVGEAPGPEPASATEPSGGVVRASAGGSSGGVVRAAGVEPVLFGAAVRFVKAGAGKFIDAAFEPVRQIVTRWVGRYEVVIEFAGKRVERAVEFTVDRLEAGVSTVVNGARLVYDGARWVAERGAQMTIDGVRYVWNGVKWVAKTLADLIENGWLASAEFVRDRLLNPLVGRTSPPCSPPALVDEPAPASGAPAWAEVSKSQLSVVHVCKAPDGDNGVKITLKSNREGAMLVQVPAAATGLEVQDQPTEWMRRTAADIGSLWPYSDYEGPQDGNQPVLLLGGAEMSYTLQRPDTQATTARIAPASYQTYGITLVNALFAAVPALKDAIDELVALFAVASNCWNNTLGGDTFNVGAIVGCFLKAFSGINTEGGAEQIISDAGEQLEQAAADHIRQHIAKLIQTRLKLTNLKNAVKTLGGWIAVGAGLIRWAWDAYHDNTDQRTLKYTLQPTQNTQTTPTMQPTQTQPTQPTQPTQTPTAATTRQND